MNLPKNVYQLMNYIESKGYKCYLVGGAVRDILSHKKPKDFDFTTDAKPDEIKAMFERHIETGIDFGTITVLFNDEAFEITTFRLEHRYSDGRRPDMVFYSDSLLSDLSRRDFTMNAIALDKDLNVYDYFNGMEDLKNKLLRTIGRAKVRFKEDRLRKLRAVRIACENNYLIHEDIIKSIMSDPDLPGVSSERIKAEFDRIFICEGAKRGVELLFRLHLMRVIIPELDDVVTPGEDIWDDYVKYFEESAPELSLRVYFLLHPLADKGLIKKILERLKYQRIIINQVLALFDYEKLESEEDFINRATEYTDEILKLFLKLDNALGRNPAWRRMIIKFLEYELPRKVVDLDINGNDLKDRGFVREDIGNTLNHLLRLAIKSPEINKKEVLIELVDRIKLGEKL